MTRRLLSSSRRRPQATGSLAALLAGGLSLAATPSSAAPVPATPAPAVAGPAAAKPALTTASAALSTAGKAAGTRMQWAASFEEALGRAKKERKLVLVDFYTDWCGWCKKLDRDVFAADSFLAAAAGVIGVKVNAEKEPAIARRFNVSSYPRLFFVDHDGRTLEQIRGYLSLADFTQKVKAVQQGDTEYARFRKEAGDPMNLIAGQRFARFLTDSDRLEEAIPYWQQVHDVAVRQVFTVPGNTTAVTFHREALLELGRAYAAVGLNDVARQHLEDVINAYPATPQAYDAAFRLGELDVRAGQVAKAIARLRQLIAQAPGTQAGQQAAALLRKLQATANEPGQ